MAQPGWIRGLFARLGKPPKAPDHIQQGSRGEAVAYGFLRRRGCQILARNFRHSGVKGEIDLVGWDKGTLVFIEVKTRQSKEVRAAEDAVDASKRRTLVRLARVFRRQARLTAAPYRFDVVSVYLGKDGQQAVEYFPEAFQERSG